MSEIKIGNRVELSYTGKVHGISEMIGGKEGELQYSIECRTPKGRFLGFHAVTEEMIVKKGSEGAEERL